ncbi:MFS transporter [Longispora sp. K20-0274]|uniref:MFS transporter n=1 Tax=Longispora sp. K20-0274 TaxID=3088255 RepID=UPI00399BF5A9
MRLLLRLLPPPGVGRPLAVQAAIFAVGSGLFLSGSAVFFTQVVGLSPAAVGVGLSVSGLVSMLLAVPLGSLVDRVGAQRMWVAAICLELAMYLLYPFVRGFVGFLAVVIALSLVEGSGGTARSVYTMEVIPQADRVRILAYQRSALNVGFTVGAGLAGLVLWIDTRPAYLALPLGYALVLAFNAAWVARLPRVAPTAGRPAAAGWAARFAVFADRSFLAVVTIAAVLWTTDTVYMVVSPLWLIAHTDAPRALIPWLVALNTVLVVILQVWVSRGGDTVSGAARCMRRAGFALAAACVLLAATGFSTGAVTIGLFLVVGVALTAAEMYQSAGVWGINSQLPPADLRGQYIGASRMVGQLRQILAPAALTALTVTWGGPVGWLLIAAAVSVAGVLAVPVTAWAARSPRLGSVPEPVGV